MPPIRSALMRWAGRNIKVDRVVMGGSRFESRGFDAGQSGPYADHDGPVIDGDFEEIDPGKRPTHRPSGWTRH